jgi:hypothetical protein
MAQSQQETLESLKGKAAVLKAAKAEPLKIEALPPGRYVFEITNCFVDQSPQSPLHMYAELQVVEGPNAELKGRGFFKRWNLEHADPELEKKGFQWLVRDLQDGLGIDVPDDIEKLATEVAPSMIGIVFDATLRANKDPQYPPNVFIPNDARRGGGSGEAGAKRF